MLSHILQRLCSCMSSLTVPPPLVLPLCLYTPTPDRLQSTALSQPSRWSFVRSSDYSRLVISKVTLYVRAKSRDAVSKSNVVVISKSETAILPCTSRRLSSNIPHPDHSFPIPPDKQRMWKCSIMNVQTKRT